MSAERELLGIVREIEHVEEDIRDRNKAKSDIYKAAADKGYDKKTIRKVVAARRLDADARQEQDDLFDFYMQAIDRAEKEPAHARVENIALSGAKSEVGIPAALPEHDPATGEIFEEVTTPKVIVSKASEAKTADLTTTLSETALSSLGAATAGGLSEPLATGPVSSSQWASSHAAKAPEQAAVPSVVSSGAPIHEMDRTAEGSFETGSVVAENARKAIPASPEDGNVSHAGAGESPATTIPDESVPAFLRRDHAEPNPRCEHPTGCRFAFSREKATCAKCTGWMARRKAREAESA